jgi:uncharacterized Zn finger protein
MSSYYGGWAPYVPVAERRRQAEREMQKLRKTGHPVAPVIIEGRKIASTFWGKAWCDNLESYRDFENRLPRGRTYVRNGSVVDLQITPLAVSARVSGSSIYKVTVSIAAVPKTRWQSICRDCAGGIDSLVELLQGRFSKGVMERICGQDKGLFPRPSEIRFSCDCPDGASMCKHVAAVLYGIGARLDEKPELLFRLRAVDQNDLLADLDAAAPLSTTGPAAGKILQADDVSALFGIEMAAGEAPIASEAPLRKQPSRVKPPEPKATESVQPKAKPAGLRKPALPAPEAAEGAVSAAAMLIATPTKYARDPGKIAKPARIPPPTPKTGKPRSKQPVVQPAMSKAAPELTADGFVKWWK